MRTDLERVKDFCINWHDKMEDLCIIADRDGNLDALGLYKYSCATLDGVVEYIEALERVNKIIGF